MFNIKLFVVAALLFSTNAFSSDDWFPDQTFPTEAVEAVICQGDDCTIQWANGDLPTSVKSFNLRGWLEYVEEGKYSKVRCKGPVCTWKKSGGFAGLNVTEFEM